MVYLEHLVVGNKANGDISKRVMQENKARQVFRKTNISYPVIRMGVENVCFFGKFGVLCFFVSPDLRFTLFPSHRRTPGWLKAVNSFPKKLHDRCWAECKIRLWAMAVFTNNCLEKQVQLSSNCQFSWTQYPSLRFITW